TALKVMIGERSEVPRVAKPFGSSLLESYWPEAEHLSNGLGSAVSFKIPMFGYVADLKELFTLARGWVIASEPTERSLDHPSTRQDHEASYARNAADNNQRQAKQEAGNQ